jgi:hypothetical protein
MVCGRIYLGVKWGGQFVSLNQDGKMPQSECLLRADWGSGWKWIWFLEIEKEFGN